MVQFGEARWDGSVAWYRDLLYCGSLVCYKVIQKRIREKRKQIKENLK